MCLEKREEENLPLLKIALINLYDSKTILEIAVEDQKQYRQNEDWQNKNNYFTKNGKKNNCMVISSDKQAKSYTRKLGYGKGGETFWEKLNLFL